MRFAGGGAKGSSPALLLLPGKAPDPGQADGPGAAAAGELLLSLSALGAFMVAAHEGSTAAGVPSWGWRSAGAASGSDGPHCRAPSSLLAGAQVCALPSAICPDSSSPLTLFLSLPDSSQHPLPLPLTPTLALICNPPSAPGLHLMPEDRDAHFAGVLSGSFVSKERGLQQGEHRGSAEGAAPASSCALTCQCA